MNKSTKEIGDRGEDQAEDVLKKEGYRIINRNFRTRFGELDIIAKDGETMVFVEVKKKSSDMYGSAAEMVTPGKIWKITKMANSYIQETRYPGDWRIDVVAIEKYEVKILKNITV